MLEIYRSCPKCGAHLKASQDRCSCGQTMGAALGEPQISRARQRFDYAVLALAILAIVGGMLRPDWYAAVAGGRVLDNVRALSAGRPVWNHSGAEPPARLWAYKLEGKLEEGCSKTFQQAADPKLVSGMLNFQLVGGTLAASKHTQEVAKANGQKIPWMTKEEIADGARAVGSYSSFANSCLTQAYKLVEPCERFRDALNSPEAASCLVPPVQRMLSGIAWRICAANAVQPRVRELCTVAAERMERLNEVPAPGQQQAPQQPQQPVGTAGM
jgi:hypothetical protein